MLTQYQWFKDFGRQKAGSTGKKERSVYSGRSFFL